jgi:hypothetical protein
VEFAVTHSSLPSLPSCPLPHENVRPSPKVQAHVCSQPQDTMRTGLSMKKGTSCGSLLSLGPIHGPRSQHYT